MVIRSNRSLRNALRHCSAGPPHDRRTMRAPVRRLSNRNSRENSQFLPRWINSLAHDMTIDKYQGQTFCADFGKHLLNDEVLHKGVRVVDEVEPFNSNPLGLEPTEVRRESRATRDSLWDRKRRSNNISGDRRREGLSLNALLCTTDCRKRLCRLPTRRTCPQHRSPPGVLRMRLGIYILYIRRSGRRIYQTESFVEECPPC